MKYLAIIITVLYLFSCKSVHNGRIVTDYQLNIHNDTLWVYDGERLVGRVVDTSWSSSVMGCIMGDNR